MWSTDPPGSLIRFSEAGQGARSLPFFLIFSTAWPALLAIATALLGRSVPWRERRWTAAFALGATIITVALVVWMAPTIHGLFAGDYVSVEEARRTFAMWERANFARLLAEVVLLLVALRALLGAYRAS
jgi:hypothetical protein